MPGWIAVPLLFLATCTPIPGGGAASPGGSSAGDLPPEDQLLVPAGYGSLRQEEITLSLLDGAVQVQMTPLEEWVIRLAAPDTYQRLSALRASREAASEPGSSSTGKRFLVSFYSEEEGQEFHPEDLHLENLGRRQLATMIQPMTPGWGTQRLGQRTAESAVYTFRDELNLDAGLVAEYRGVRTHDWTTILSDLLAEQARVRGRTSAP
jgi:hypothetical protein